jgi:excisionase family DNA binding protein
MEDWVNTRQAASLLGVGTTTIKRWADQGLIQHSKTAGGHRRFRQRDVKTFLASTKGEEPKIEPVTKSVKDWLELLCNHLDVEAATASLLEARSRLGAWHLVANECGQMLGLLGMMWADGQISVYQEQNASMGLRRALASCIRMFPTPSRDQLTCLAVPAEGDNHMGGVQLVEIVARAAGWNAVSAAAPLPISEVGVWIKALPRIDLLAVSASSYSSNAGDLGRQYRELDALSKELDLRLVLGGSGAWPNDVPMEQRMNEFSHFNQILVEMEKDVAIREYDREALKSIHGKK